MLAVFTVLEGTHSFDLEEGSKEANFLLCVGVLAVRKLHCEFAKASRKHNLLLVNLLTKYNLV